MKRYLTGAVLVLFVLTMAVGSADTQLGRVHTNQYLQAGDGGGPIPTCRPGANCGPDDTLRQVSSYGLSLEIESA